MSHNNTTSATTPSKQLAILHRTLRKCTDVQERKRLLAEIFTLEKTTSLQPKREQNGNHTDALTSTQSFSFYSSLPSSSSSAPQNNKSTKKKQQTPSSNHQINDDLLEQRQALRLAEEQTVNSTLSALGLSLSEIVGDGACLFTAIHQQLQQLQQNQQSQHNQNDARPPAPKSPQELKEIICRHIKDNAAKYTPFLIADDAEYDVSSQVCSVEDYCSRLVNKNNNSVGGGLWGGEVEIQVLCDAFDTCIHVIAQHQAAVRGDTVSNVRVYGKCKSGDCMFIVYWRYKYSLGAHYDSTNKSNQ